MRIEIRAQRRECDDVSLFVLLEQGRHQIFLVLFGTAYRVS